ncbi:MAG: synthase epsilon subunit [Bryobacterales bacterium]|jgi:F-type H+-transporting ATPase subunit epsilon|nr:synthase epsilon subunit [Bryobacterales bacterium]
MAETLHLQVVGPERMFVDEQVTEAQIPARDGFIGVLPGHAALLSALKPGGVLTYVAGGQLKKLAVYGGFVEVLASTTKVLVDAAEFGTDIDRAKAQARLATATAAGSDQDEIQKAQAAVDAAA